ncbi:MAG: hypothetical protein ABIR38_07460 [Chthoniobacterales bacterium]
MSDPVLTLVDGKTIFVCADRSWNGRDLLDAALFRGELQPEWEDLLRSLAAERRADEQNLEVDDEAFDSAAEQFRYERDLITAEETEQWLAERGVSLEEFSAHFVRRYWAGHWDDVAAEEMAYLAAPNEMRKRLTDELVLSGKLDGMAIRQSWRVAAYQEAASAGIDPGLIEEQRAQFLERCGIEAEGLVGWLEQVGRDPEWLQEALMMEAIYHRDRAALLSPRAREHEIAALRLPLTRFEVETIELDSLDAAREALLCARDDGMSMEEVATEGRYPYRHPEVLLEDIPEDLQQKFLSVHPGDILEPIARGDGFHLCRIVGKKEPNLDDPVVKARADQRILDRHFSDLSTRHIQWRTLLA